MSLFESTFLAEAYRKHLNDQSIEVFFKHLLEVIMIHTWILNACFQGIHGKFVEQPEHGMLANSAAAGSTS